MAGSVRIVDRIKARQAARQAWISAKQSGDDAILIFERNPSIASLDPVTIALLIRIAIMLFEHWMRKKIDEPSVVIQPDEPGFDEANDAD